MEMTSTVKHNSFERPENLLLLSEIRKRIITFRHIIDLPHCHSSDLMLQLVMGTIEDLHYPEVVICNFTAETEESFLHQALSHLYNILEVIRDSWAKAHRCIIDAGDDTDDSMEHITAEQLSRRVLVKLDQMIDIAREMWIEEYEKKNKGRVQGSEAEDMLSESLPNKKVKCLSPNTPVSYYSDLAFSMDPGKLANASYSSPFQFHFRLQVLEKLKPIELKYVPLDTCPLTSSPGYSMSNVTRITVDETKAEVQDIVASPDKVSHQVSKTSKDSESSSKIPCSNRNVMPEAKESAVESAGKVSYQVSKKSDSEEPPKTSSSNINLKAEAKRSAVESADKVSYQASKTSKDSKMSPKTLSSDKNRMPEGKEAAEESADKVSYQVSNIVTDSGKSPKTSSSNMNVMPGTKGLAAMSNSPPPPPIPSRPSSQPSSVAVAPPPPPPTAPPSKGSVAVTSSPMQLAKGAVPPPPPPQGAVPPPPPPPLGVARALRARTRNKLKRSSHMGNLYRLLKGKLEGFSFNGRSPKERKSKIGGSSGSTQSMADALAEMTKRSAYFHQIEEDVKKHSKSIMEIKADINSFQTKDMAELLKFEKHVEQTLEKLTDETQVLAKFEGFPSKKLESLRAAAALYSKLEEIATTLENWKVMPPLGQLLDKVQSYFDKIKGEIEALERSKDEESKRFESNNIHFNFRILDRIKESMVDVSSSCMALALAERMEAKGAEPRTKGQPNASIKMMWRAFQLAYRVYSFAGGQDDRADVLTKELAHEIEIDPEPR